MRGRDRWVGGAPSMVMRIAGVIAVVNSSGKRLAHAAMLCWLGEMIWFPQAVLSTRVEWSQSGDQTSEGTVVARGQRAVQTFVIDSDDVRRSSARTVSTTRRRGFSRG